MRSIHPVTKRLRAPRLLPLAALQKCAYLIFLIFGPGLTVASGQRADLKIGDLLLDFSGTVGVTWDDNINTSEFNPEDDIYFSAGVSASGSWPIREGIALDFGAGLQYRKYLKNSDLDSTNTFLTVTPETRIGFAVTISDLALTMTNEIRFDTDATDAVFIDEDTQDVTFDIFNFGRFENVFSARAEWQVNSVFSLYGVYTQTDLIPLDNIFENIRRTVRTYELGARYRLNTEISLGPFVRWSDTHYRRDFQNDATGFSYGGFLNWQITDYVSFNLTAQRGTNDFDFIPDDELEGSNRDNNDADTVTYTATLSQNAHSTFSHSFTFSRSTNLAFINNFTTVDSIRYRFTWTGLSESATIDGGVRFESGIDSGGISREDYDLFQADISLGYQLTSRLDWRLTYLHANKTSDVRGRSYDRNRLSFTLFYDF